ncbi:MAG TPA: TIGR03668 family PPOX class F420-dependent oxidoreductase [Candidatus Limnocylindrales bacterium]|nr:TIGR03668 family PPOX class F420-dependent oxidoreductase [Candidatus Limnocylindrales bacterium]
MIGAGDTDALQRLAGARVGHLATASSDGRPHVVPLCFAVVSGAAYSVIDEKPKRTRTNLRRLRNIEANPRATLLVDHYEEEWKALWFVMAECDAHVVTDEREFLAALEALRSKYPQYRRMTLAFATHPMIRLRIDRLVSWQGSAD